MMQNYVHTCLILNRMLTCLYIFVQHTQSKHVPLPSAVIDNCEVFERLLEIEESGYHSKPKYEDFKKELEQFGIPIDKLCSSEENTLSYENSWNSTCNSHWICMLGNITLSYIRYFSLECYMNCGRGVDDVTSYHQLGGKVGTMYLF